MQVTKVLSADPRVSDSAERKLHHQNMGCVLGTIVSAMTNETKSANPIATESLLLEEIGRKRKAQVDGGYPLNKKYGLPIP